MKEKSNVKETKIAQLKIGKRIIVKDAMIMLYEKAKSPEWPHVVVPSGDYLVTMLDDDAGRMVRVIGKLAKKATRGAEIGKVSVDHAAVAICDYDALLKAVKDNLEEYGDWTCNECESAVWEHQSGTLKFMNVEIAHLKTGSGDGTFSVFELTDGKKIIGLECTFPRVVSDKAKSVKSKK